MFWKKSRPQRRPTSFRPTFEPLESRLAMAASIVPFTDFDGTAGVRVTDGSAASDLSIFDDMASDTQTITLKQKNKPDIVVQGAFRVFDIDMGGGNDQVTYFPQGANFDNDRRVLHVNLGSGRNSFFFDESNITQVKNNSNLDVEVVGGSGNDFINIGIPLVSDSTVTVRGQLGRGADGELDAKNKVIGPSRVRIGDDSQIINSAVLVDFDLGTGSNNFTVGGFGSIGESVGAPPSQVAVRVVGSEKAGDSDHVTVDLANTKVSPGGRLAIAVDLLAGNDFFTGLVPNTFAIKGSGNDQVGGEVSFDVNGGKGNDQISVTRNGTVGPTDLDGLLTLLLSGGEGNDNINVDFAGSGFFTTTNGSAQDRGLRIRAAGDAGNDTMNVLVSNDSNGTFFYDIQMFAGTGNDKVTFAGNNIGNGASLGPNLGKAGVVLVDGGAGTDLRQINGNLGAGVLKVGFEGVLA